jgi:hypothetical protein
MFGRCQLQDLREERARELEEAAAEVERAVEVEREMGAGSSVSYATSRSIRPKRKAPRRDPWGFLLFSSPFAHLATNAIVRRIARFARVPPDKDYVTSAGPVKETLEIRGKSIAPHLSASRSFRI